MLPVFRVLISGSRDWVKARQIHQALDFLYLMTRGAYRLLVVHGDCPTGADYFARVWVEAKRAAGHLDIAQEPHAVTRQEWRTIGPAAGPLRNKRMVDRGGYRVALIFNRNNSRGTQGCRELAEAAGIPILDWTD